MRRRLHEAGARRSSLDPGGSAEVSKPGERTSKADPAADSSGPGSLARTRVHTPEAGVTASAVLAAERRSRRPWWTRQSAKMSLFIVIDLSSCARRRRDSTARRGRANASEINGASVIGSKRGAA